jgi:ADP-ribose pyrophosphatase YjhB (NUDIX family)
MTEERFKLIAAVFILLLKDGKVFLARRSNTGWEDGKYCLPGGHFNGNETAGAVAIREAKEELGITIAPEDLRFFNICHIQTNDERIHFSFVAEKWQGEAINNEPGRASEVDWFPINNLPEDMNDLAKATIEWYQKNLYYTEFGWGK